MGTATKAIGRVEVTRRSVMLGAAGLTFTAAMGRSELTAAAPSTVMNAWVTIFADGSIQIMSPATEMGQGSKTSLPLILAEEMDANWNDVRIVPAPPSDALYGNPGFLGIMYTAGSTAVFGYFDQLRMFGAQVRRVLIENAAGSLGVSADELTTESSVVVHAPSGRRLLYGAIAAFAKVPATAPQIPKEQLKKSEAFRLIGRDVMRYELPTKVNGAARYSIDVELPDMLYGAMIYPPSLGAQPDKVSDDGARKIKDLVGIYRLPIGIGVSPERLGPLGPRATQSLSNGRRIRRMPASTAVWRMIGTPGSPAAKSRSNPSLGTRRAQAPTSSAMPRLGSRANSVATTPTMPKWSL